MFFTDEPGILDGFLQDIMHILLNEDHAYEEAIVRQHNDKR